MQTETNKILTIQEAISAFPQKNVGWNFYKKIIPFRDRCVVANELIEDFWCVLSSNYSDNQLVETSDVIQENGEFAALKYIETLVSTGDSVTTVRMSGITFDLKNPEGEIVYSSNIDNIHLNLIIDNNITGNSLTIGESLFIPSGYTVSFNTDFSFIEAVTEKGNVFTGTSTYPIKSLTDNLYTFSRNLILEPILPPTGETPTTVDVTVYADLPFSAYYYLQDVLSTTDGEYYSTNTFIFPADNYYSTSEDMPNFVIKDVPVGSLLTFKGIGLMDENMNGALGYYTFSKSTSALKYPIYGEKFGPNTSTNSYLITATASKIVLKYTQYTETYYPYA